jgi:hypothetical protein
MEDCFSYLFLLVITQKAALAIEKADMVKLDKNLHVPTPLMVLRGGWELTITPPVQGPT